MLQLYFDFIYPSLVSLIVQLFSFSSHSLSYSALLVIVSSQSITQTPPELLPLLVLLWPL